MRIGFFLKWPKGQFNSAGMNVLGDELYAESMCRTLSTMDGVESAEIFAPNYLPRDSLDVMVYLNDTEPDRHSARRHVLYMQNAYGAGSQNMLKGFQKIGYDGYAFISNRLLNMHRQDGYEGIFLPFGVNVEMFSPRPISPEYSFDVAYIGNDIKGEKRTTEYLLPAADYDFGLYGNWSLPDPGMRDRLKFWRRTPHYRKVFAKISRGKIPQENVAALYSSARINLNCTAQDCVDWDVITLRTYEVLACKGFLITDKVPAAEKTMQGCMVFTDGGDDLTGKIDHYLSREADRAAIAQAGYAYVMEHATIGSRMKELMAYLESVI